MNVDVIVLHVAELLVDLIGGLVAPEVRPADVQSSAGVHHQGPRLTCSKLRLGERGGDTATTAEQPCPRTAGPAGAARVSKNSKEIRRSLRRRRRRLVRSRGSSD
eukprot:11251081-Alexandrium_andersonii.AAC.1